MRHDEFVGQLQHRAHLASRGAAEGAIRASTSTSRLHASTPASS